MSSKSNCCNKDCINCWHTLHCNVDVRYIQLNDGVERFNFSYTSIVINEFSKTLLESIIFKHIEHQAFENVYND